MAGIHNVLAGSALKATPVLVGSQYTQSVSVTSFSQPVPASNTGDLILLVVICPVNISLPSGWTQLDYFANTGLHTLICYKTAASPSESNFTISIGSTQNVGSAIFRFAGASNPASSLDTAFTYGSSGNASFQGMTGNQGDYYIQYFHAANASAVFTKPSGSTGALLTDSDSISPSFASFYSTGSSSPSSSSAFTQPSGGGIRSGQIRIPSL